MDRPYLKLCGLRSEHDVRIASRSLADYVGFVMAESKRKVNPHEAASWLERHSMPKKKVAALFVNAALKDIQETVNILSPDIIQLHGTESPDTAVKIKQRFDVEVWKALPHDQGTINKMQDYLSTVDGFVIDAKVKGAWGGTGQRFNWSHVPMYVDFGMNCNVPVLIAGGITPDNVVDLLPMKPWGVDLSSGIETEGLKDKQQLTRLEKRLNEK